MYSLLLMYVAMFYVDIACYVRIVASPHGCNNNDNENDIITVNIKYNNDNNATYKH